MESTVISGDQEMAGKLTMFGGLAFSVLLLLVLRPAGACLVPPYQAFSPKEFWQQGVSAPELPRLALEGVHRGSQGLSSCSDIAWIELRVENNGSNPAIGYSFELIENSAGQDFAPRGYILPRIDEDGGARFRLVWIERPGDDGFLPPVKLEIESKSISEKGLESSASRISVYSRGLSGNRLPIQKPPASKTVLYELKYGKEVEK